MFACCHLYFRLQLPLIIIHITCISLSLRRTSAPIHLTSVLGVLGTQETSCILIAGLLERDTFNHFLPEFDKPLVIHLRETCCCSTNLCTWRPNNCLQEKKCVDIKLFSGAVASEERKKALTHFPPRQKKARKLFSGVVAGEVR